MKRTRPTLPLALATLALLAFLPAEARANAGPKTESLRAKSAAGVCYRNRMYSAELGRFGRRDPVLGGDSLYNAYGFPGSDSVNQLDPYGEWGDKFLYDNALNAINWAKTKVAAVERRTARIKFLQTIAADPLMLMDEVDKIDGESSEFFSAYNLAVQARTQHAESSPWWSSLSMGIRYYSGEDQYLNDKLGSISMPSGIRPTPEQQKELQEAMKAAQRSFERIEKGIGRLETALEVTDKGLTAASFATGVGGILKTAATTAAKEAARQGLQRATTRMIVQQLGKELGKTTLKTAGSMAGTYAFDVTLETTGEALGFSPEVIGYARGTAHTAMHVMSIWQLVKLNAMVKRSEALDVAQYTGSGASRGAHRGAANKDLLARLEADPKLNKELSKQLGVEDAAAAMRSGKGGNIVNPPGTTWHHAAENPRALMLLTKGQHTDPKLQDAWHPGPGGSGGYAAGTEAGAW